MPENDNVFEGLVPLKSEKEDTVNLRGDAVHSGFHRCCICKKEFDSYGMIWTTEPKLCLACYYDL